MKTILSLFSLTLMLVGCTKKQSTDLIIYHANIYTVDHSFNTANAMVITNERIVEVGFYKDLKHKYKAKKEVDMNGKTILPGLYDAHAHFYGLGLQQRKVNLVGTTSWENVLERLLEFKEKYNPEYITGRGWDQNDWEVNVFPNNKKLSELFPNTPVMIRRVDGHALIANKKAIELAKITTETPYSGGEIQQINGELTGLFIDNPLELVEAIIPEPNQQDMENALKDAEKICLKHGLTSVVDAGLNKVVLDEIFRLNDEMDINLYVMGSSTDPQLKDVLKTGFKQTNRLSLRSIKCYADGALGSRGACLHEAYSDRKKHFGALLTPIEEFKTIAKKIHAHGFQMNTHAIGDSANTVVLNTYLSTLDNPKEARWRVEHAQVLKEDDIFKFKQGIIPSVQPTHATSDMYWAKDRLGEDRIPLAYAYKTLLKANGRIALGTDFPIEKVNPFHTFYSATARKDLKHYPKNGFQIKDALTRKEALKGMTIWAAYSCFQENERGSLEQGKYADFIVLDRDIITCKEDSIPTTQVLSTFIKGKEVYRKVE